MVEKRDELLMSQAQLREKSCTKWSRRKIMVIFCIPTVALLPMAIRCVQPTAKIMFLVVANSLSWINPPCFYVLLNVIIVTLGVKSGALATGTSFNEAAAAAAAINEHNTHTGFKSDSDTNYTTPIHTITSENNIVRCESKVADGCSEDPVKDLVVQGRGSFRELQQKPNDDLYCKKSRCTSLRRSSAKLSNLSRESSRITQSDQNCSIREESAPEVIFEICADEGGDHDMHLDLVENETDRKQPATATLTSDELCAKADSFIRNFYRELKMQRENSWKRLCSIYRQSC